MHDVDFPIPSKRCQEGASLCLDNAIRLLKEAKLLFENEIYLTSCCLAIYALEEIGKGEELLEAFKSQKNVTKTKWRKLSKRTYAHVRKIKTGRKLAMKRLEERFDFILNRFRLSSLSDSRYEEVRWILAKHDQWWKEQCLYVGWEQNKWTIPMRFRKSDQMLFATLKIIEIFEGCMAIAVKLGRDASDIKKALNEFGATSFQRWNYILGINCGES